MLINKIQNANVFIDGNNMLGAAEEINVPFPKTLSIDHAGLGVVGKLDVFGGFDKLECTVKWNSVYIEELPFSIDVIASHQYMVFASVEQYSAQGRSAELPLIMTMTARVTDPGQLSLKHLANAGHESKLSVTHCDLSIGGVPQFLYDVFAGVFEIEGVDQLAVYRANMGIAI